MREARLLPFVSDPAARGSSVGSVHADGSITFRGTTYRTIRSLPPECRSLRPDVAIEVQWRKMYRAVDPARKARRT